MCYWAGDNLKFARQHAKEYSQIGVAASLSVLFHAPLFGLFEVEENTLEENNSEQTVVPAGISSKIFIYGIAIAAATGIYAGLSAVFGSGLSGFPSFEAVEIGKMDYALILLYIIAGCVLAVFYEKTHQITKKTAKKVPAVLREVLAGICLGICGMLIPAVMFSGEEQMGVLMKEYSQYLPLALIGVAFLKVLLTNICIQFGLKGGHFFPVIFAGVCMGYGVGMLILRKCRESSSFRICNCYSGASRWNDEKAVSRYNASISMLSSEIVRMDFCGCGSRQPNAILI